MAFCHQTNSDEYFIRFLFQDLHLFHSWKANRGMKLSRNLRTRGNNHLQFCGLCFWQHVSSIDYGHEENLVYSSTKTYFCRVSRGTKTICKIINSSCFSLTPSWDRNSSQRHSTASSTYEAPKIALCSVFTKCFQWGCARGFIREKHESRSRWRSFHRTPLSSPPKKKRKLDELIHPRIKSMPLTGREKKKSEVTNDGPTWRWRRSSFEMLPALVEELVSP